MLGVDYDGWRWGRIADDDNGCCDDEGGDVGGQCRLIIVLMLASKSVHRGNSTCGASDG